MSDLLIIIGAMLLFLVAGLWHRCIQLRSWLTLTQWKLDQALYDVGIERRRAVAVEAQLDQLIVLPAYGRKLVAHIDQELGLADAVRRN